MRVYKCPTLPYLHARQHTYVRLESYLTWTMELYEEIPMYITCQNRCSQTCSTV